MQKGKQWDWVRRLGSSLLAAAILAGSGLTAYAAAPAEVIPIGRTAGIKMSAEGVMVVRLSGVQTAIGEVYPAKQAGLHEGDQIVSADGKQVTSNESLQKTVAAAGEKAVALQVRRDGQAMEVKVIPVMDTTGQYKIGVMVRDSMAGIGTITYVDPDTGAYGSLGHGICDMDTGVLLPLGKGSVMESAVSGVQKGEAGKPGELKGEFNLQQDMGSVVKNTDSGVFGTLTDDSYYKALGKMQVAAASEVKAGPAQILSNIEGEETALYDVEIVKIYDENDDLGRCMMLHVTDPKLLDKTGGIVQGMSGSPLIQNGKLVGAVTHVLVNDPTRGYAIFVEKMLEEMAK
ncbi:SpoIVB peptidase [Intestinibacillus massiliensis]|uniref:SpoIVB peptidase n=1 Tax=Intestinibacillus massiliensis TaxID=1871029 RepID=UPI00117A3AB2|nr:SpoIVB peptidase [Intestinibacillus massiliensis]